MSEVSRANQSARPILHHKNRLSYALEHPPEIGVPVKVANGIWILNLPYAGTMDHVNAYVLQDDDGLMLIDTGPNSEACRNAIDSVLNHEPFRGQQIKRVLATHFHPDHLGLAGEICEPGRFSEQGAELITTRTCWLAANLLQSTNLNTPRREHVNFLIRTGMDGMELEAFRRRKPSSYPDQVTPLPQSYRSVDEATQLSIGNRTWRVRLSQGHCPDQITLWSNDGLAIVADQILPNVSPSLAVHYSDPHADHVSQWLASCHRFGSIANVETLCFPGHGVPFRGAPLRCQQMIDTCISVLDRLLIALSKPMTVIECLDVIYRRVLHPKERMILIGVVVAYLNHLQSRGLVVSRSTRTGALIWRRVSSITSYQWNAQ